MSKQRMFLFFAITLQMVTVLGLIFIGREVLAQDDVAVPMASMLDSADNARSTVGQTDSMIINKRQIYRDFYGYDMLMLPIAYGYVNASGSFGGTPNASVSVFGPGGYSISIDNKDCGDFTGVVNCIALVTAVDGARASVVALGGDINVYTFVSGLPVNNAFQFVIYGF